ncbi:glycosyltransferase family 2 protein [Cellulomonas carbonis]|uniref:Glycosyltransferase 2-like domain-containing protein n=1 Tax=Cellulomonas carbonis T26 TaxID=947969 RepID=A0A0A0BPM3_9CELL|nr:glycosyltransferase family 2 protein [Cellulomonas carbonis]KGM09034.1 hypothetical protein N868_04680 [Cellulomonas carbonis T26]GGC11333.1 dTDP-rhamnosyl transferase RfbF [Cellulomonas carbonis]
MADVPLVVAVVVTYRPRPEPLARLLEELAPQVASTVVVDNGTPDPEALRTVVASTAGAELLELGDNTGIAAAQNRGIERARGLGADLVLLSDQDSLPAPDMVERLVRGLADARARRAAGARPVAAVGPVTVDERNEGAALLFADRRWGPRRADVPDVDGALVPATFLIASGTLVDVAALDAVGPMNEDWFIDHVDLEWGLRARRAGFDLLGVVGARLDHQLGDRTQRIPGRRPVHVHSPVRNYYMVRNTLLLVRTDLMPAAWRVGYVAWIVKYVGFYVLLVAPRARRAVLMARGVLDAVRDRGGRLEVRH